MSKINFNILKPINKTTSKQHTLEQQYYIYQDNIILQREFSSAVTKILNQIEPILINKNKLIDIDHNKIEYIHDGPFHQSLVQTVLITVFNYKRIHISDLISLIYKQEIQSKSSNPIHKNKKQIDKSLKYISLILELLVHKDHIDYDPDNGYIYNAYTIKKKIIKLLKQHQYPLPMLIKPKRVSKNNCGYIYYKKPLISSPINTKEYSPFSLCYEYINKINSIPLSINTNIIGSGNLIRHQYKYDEKKPEETLKKYKLRKAQQDTFVNTSIDYTIGISELSNNTIYLTHHYDFRGRVYVNGYHINYQGDDIHKAVIELKNKKKLKY